MSDRLAATFARLRQHQQAAFVAYIGAGDPSLEHSLEVMRALEEAGVDVIELGVPFSDPLADGIVNQMAAQRALEAGTRTSGVLQLIQEFRRGSEVPVILFTYLNPVFTYGFEKFHADAAGAGADGVLLLDLPPDEAAARPDLQRVHGLSRIRLIAPTTPPERMREIAAGGEGFIYYVSRTGVTGAGEALSDDIASQVAVIRGATAVPVCVGFGISTPAQVASVASAADGVVVGSAIVRVIEEAARQGRGPAETARQVGEFVKPLVAAAKGR